MYTLFFSMLVGIAQAQSTCPTPTVPDMNAQLYRFPVDSDRTLWADDSAVGPTGWFGARIGAMYVRDPLIWQCLANDEVVSESRVLSDAIQADAIASFAVSRLRFGVDIPVIARSASELLADSASTTGIGDLALDVKGNVVDGAKNPLGLALGARITFPSGSLDTPINAPGTGWQIQGIIDKRTDKMLFAANIGTQGGKQTDFIEIDSQGNPVVSRTWKNQFVFRAGLGLPVDEQSGFSADIAGHLDYDGMFTPSDTQPVELLVGGWTKVAGNLNLRGGVGTGLVQAVGSPAFRALMMLSYDPPRDGNRPCAEGPEDYDGYMDDDNCLDPDIEVHLMIQDKNGNPIDGVRTTVDVGPGSTEIGSYDMRMMMNPGTYTMAAEADGYKPLHSNLTVPQGVTRHEVVKIMDALGSGVRLKVVDAETGAALPATYAIDTGEARQAKDGLAQWDARPGKRTIDVSAEGYYPAQAVAEVQAGQFTEVLVQLNPKKVVVECDQIRILEKVHFDFDRDTIQDVSYPILNEVADTLREHKEIRKVRIEGHTDSRGSRAYNQDLSNRRAASVLRYLVDKGIARDRLTSIGYGESKPIAGTASDKDSESVHEQNRRVEFHIVEGDRPEGCPAE